MADGRRLTADAGSSVRPPAPRQLRSRNQELADGGNDRVQRRALNSRGKDAVEEDRPLPPAVLVAISITEARRHARRDGRSSAVERCPDRVRQPARVRRQPGRDVPEVEVILATTASNFSATLTSTGYARRRAAGRSRRVGSTTSTGPGSTASPNPTSTWTRIRAPSSSAASVTRWPPYSLSSRIARTSTEAASNARPSSERAPAASSRKISAIRSGLGSPKPRRSASFVALGRMPVQTVKSIAPLRTYALRWGDSARR
jgi:hypothetical protein